MHNALLLVMFSVELIQPFHLPLIFKNIKPRGQNNIGFSPAHSLTSVGFTRIIIITYIHFSTQASMNMFL